MAAIAPLVGVSWGPLEVGDTCLQGCAPWREPVCWALCPECLCLSLAAGELREVSESPNRMLVSSWGALSGSGSPLTGWFRGRGVIIQRSWC